MRRRSYPRSLQDGGYGWKRDHRPPNSALWNTIEAGRNIAWTKWCDSKKWWVVSRPRISNSGITIDSYSHHSCTQTGSISVVIEVWLIWLMRFVYCLSQSRDKKWKIKAAPNIKLLHLFILTAGTMLYFVRCCKCNVISFASFVLIRMRKLEQAIF